MLSTLCLLASLATSGVSPAEWDRDAVVYEIFPDRFANEDPRNDPSDVLPWGTRPSGSSWLGGDIAGVRKHLDHIRALGADTIYFNPIFSAKSSHRWDTVDYLQVDPRFGTNGELKSLVSDAHRQHLRVMLDGVFNQTSTDSFAFKDLVANQQASAYRGWYYVSGYPVRVGPGPVNYQTVGGSLARINVNNPGVRSYLFDACRRWTRDFGVDGWHIDAADRLGHNFCLDIRTDLRNVKPQILVFGDRWGGDAAKQPDPALDAIVDYPWRQAVLDFLATGSLTPGGFDRALTIIRPVGALATGIGQSAVMPFNVLGSHDTERLRTVMHNDLRREKLAIVLQMTLPGIPWIYYGDEVGMEGGNDPDNRRCMEWDSTKWDRDLFGFYRQMIAMHKRERTLRYGDYRTLIADDKRGLFGFERSYLSHKVHVFLNVSSAPQSVHTESGSKIMAPMSYIIAK